jgi:transcriptional regulator with XRE-family HTH domain
MKKVIELIDFVPNLDIIKIDIPKLVTCIYKEMPMNIKEIRYKTGLSQREFSNMFSIPLSTLQKWEQGESSPSPYVVSLIANQLPINTDSLYRIEDNKGKIYYYNREAGFLIDSIGTKIKIGEDLEDVNKNNLSLYVSDLFESYYEIVDKFNRDCKLDKMEDIIWS